ncbi:C2H2-like zinc finger protein isoform X3 [Carex rostrata]
MPLTKANRILALRKTRINLLSSAMKNVCRIKADLPGWPLLPSTPKVEMQKCEKCSKEFCSTINYRRHIKTHRRSPNIDKEFHKNRDEVGKFWDKLTLNEAEDIVSLAAVDIEGTSGTTILKYLSLWNSKPNISSLPSAYVKAGRSLLGIVEGAAGCLPLTSKELFSILNDASENTFMCAGNATLVQKFLFDGDAEKIIIEMKNLVACMSFLLELKLVGAWLADKAAKALWCQKLLVEEEEAAQKRKSELIEKKRLKKLRQKKEKLKDASDPGNKAPVETVEEVIVSPRAPSPTAQSESGSSSLEEAAPLNKSVQLEPEANHDQIESHNLICDSFYVLDSKSSVEPEIKQEHSCDKVNMENERGPVLSDSLEVLIGSISIPVEDTSLVGSGLTQMRSVDYKENSHSKDTERVQVELDKNGIQSGSVGSYGKSDDRLDMCKELSLAWRDMVPGPRLFSCEEAAAFLSLRWKEAIAGDHVTLILSSDSEASDSPEDLSCTDSTLSPSDMVSNATKPKSKSK